MHVFMISEHIDVRQYLCLDIMAAILGNIAHSYLKRSTTNVRIPHSDASLCLCVCVCVCVPVCVCVCVCVYIVY